MNQTQNADTFNWLKEIISRAKSEEDGFQGFSVCNLQHIADEERLFTQIEFKKLRALHYLDADLWSYAQKMDGAKGKAQWLSVWKAFLSGASDSQGHALPPGALFICDNCGRVAPRPDPNDKHCRGKRAHNWLQKSP